MTHHKTQIILINFAAVPLLAINIVARLGVSTGSFIISGLVWALVVWLTKFFSAFIAPERPEEAQAIDEEVERMEGRRMRLHNSFEVCAPEGFKFKTIDADNMCIINIESGARLDVHIVLKDGKRVTEIINQAIEKLK